MKDTKKFLFYVLPSLFAFALSGVYCIVDGFFIGNKIGDNGLTAINIAFPVAALLQAAGTGLGMGGAILYSLKNSASNFSENKKYFGGTLLLLSAVSIILTVASYFLAEPLLKLLGAEGAILELGMQYLKIMAIGATLQIFGTGLLPFIRNMGGSLYAMLAMTAGFVTNIILDWLFIFKLDFGMTGAAAATLIGQAVTLALSAIYFPIKKTTPKLPEKQNFGKTFFEIAKTALSPFGLTFSPMISLILMNKFCLLSGGDGAVAAYACISYIMTILFLTVQGVGDGSQPLLSNSYAENNIKQMKKFRVMSFIFAGAIAAICAMLLYFFRFDIGKLFGSSKEIAALTGEAMPFFLLGIPFIVVARISTSYFYAVGKNSRAYIVVYAEPIMLLAALLTLPRFLALTGVWISMPVSQLLSAAAAVAAGLIKKDKKSVRKMLTENSEY